MKDFKQDYFLRTRQEIDAEKHSRDTILNVIIIVLGAVGFALFQSGNAEVLLKHPISFVLEVTILVTIPGLFWLRRKKLHQIADRWFVLYYLNKHHINAIPLNETLEAIVKKDLETTRYTIKDLGLCFAICCPIYGLIAASVYEQISMHLWRVVIIIGIVLFHLTIASLLMIRSFKCPEPLASACTRYQPKEETEDSDNNVRHPCSR